MSFNYQLPPYIDLFVRNKITLADAHRQKRTVTAVLQRLQDRPGLILADEVGMGKTFVALGVAISVYLQTGKPVVIMIPPNLVEKWPRDFNLFCTSCISDVSVRDRLRCAIAESTEDFLKLLNDTEEKLNAVIFLKHGALSRRMNDGWVRLAVLRRTIYRRWDSNDILKRVVKYASELADLRIKRKRREEVDWEALLSSDPRTWGKLLRKWEVFDENDDDPVPEMFLNELYKLESVDFNQLWNSLNDDIPKRDSERTYERLDSLRKVISSKAIDVWKHCLQAMSFNLPLLIFDEAHHLKNEQTQLVVKLFQDSDADKDSGLLNGQFDRMLFLTATPFQLGHRELLSVLDRFSAINWGSDNIPALSKHAYKEELTTLLRSLDDFQLSARKLDNYWSRLKPQDLVYKGEVFTDVYQWWQAITTDRADLPSVVANVIDAFEATKDKLRVVDPLLRRYVIRHTKARYLSEPYSEVSRRSILPGRSIMTGVEDEEGIEVSKDGLLPFLLAARLTVLQPDKRPVFAEGLASSYEAFQYTRHEKAKRFQAAVTDTDDEASEDLIELDKTSEWYLNQLDASIDSSRYAGARHPKMQPTVDKAIELWSKGEKVLIFCHYIATARSLRKYVSQAMKTHIRLLGAAKFHCEADEVFDEVERVATRFNDKDSPVYRAASEALHVLINEFAPNVDAKDDLLDVLVRYMKTPSFLVRFAPDFEFKDNPNEWFHRCMETKDVSGLTLKQIITRFLVFLEERPEDRDSYIAALKSAQPGGIRAKDIVEAYSDDELPEEQDNIVMANVRLCYGATKHETRQKLMKTFNTPFFPDVLITSSVMAEGVDLHLNCRHIIHHDLCWNPSTLEQRTGRVDRIGAKAERCGQPIQVYLPYLSQTQDEKMYRVVMERERWFNIVMGEKYRSDAASTDAYAERVPLPVQLAEELAFSLEVVEMEKAVLGELSV